MQPDTEIFENNSTQKSNIKPSITDIEFPAASFDQVSQTHAFNEAAMIVLTTVLPAQIFMELAAELNQEADQTDYEFVDGLYIWEYTHTVEGESATIRYEAEPDEASGEVEWRLYLSIENQEFSIDNELFMRGTTSQDGSSGNWEIYDVTGSSGDDPVLSFNWTIDGNENLSTIFTINADGQTVTIEYEEDGNMRTLMFTSSTEDVDIVITWNAETGAGSITNNGNQMCWDSNFDDIAC